MGALFDLLKDIPHIAVLKEKITAFEDENAALKTENAILKDDLREAKAENKRLKEEIDSLTHKDDLDEISIKILVMLAEQKDHSYAQTLAHYLQLSMARVEFYLGELLKGRYISTARPRLTRPATHNLTQKGREFLIKNDLI